MFNIGFTEMIILGIIALVFIGPNQLPDVARNIGRLLNELKRATSDFQTTFTTHISTEVKDRIDETRQQHADNERIQPETIVDIPQKDDGHES